ncbi:hypothetical protein PVAND_011056 [Polypedilum vanderplanki]|uniref:MCM domain-containing protein n=1 Tax=Polypedilum vanderplanki TaxID=319348 RepID=A0A9J6CHG9_POLVA|nr:hypothetical protein PVAND_011056 [Polypedilum vanderplanki]
MSSFFRPSPPPQSSSSAKRRRKAFEDLQSQDLFTTTDFLAQQPSLNFLSSPTFQRNESQNQSQVFFTNTQSQHTSSSFQSYYNIYPQHSQSPIHDEFNLTINNNTQFTIFDEDLDDGEHDEIEIGSASIAFEDFFEKTPPRTISNQSSSYNSSRTQSTQQNSQFDSIDTCEHNSMISTSSINQRQLLENSLINKYALEKSIDRCKSNSTKSINSLRRNNSTLETSLNVTIIENDDGDFLPESITKLHKELKNAKFSDYTFISIIAGQLCTEIFPMGVYNNLKIALLMSLVAIKSSPIHIIAIGQETSHANIIMNTVGKLSQRFLCVGQNFEGITVKKNSDIVEAGPMSLTMNGIAYIGNWSRLTPKVMNRFLREIEIGVIVVDKLQKNFPLKSTIWSHWSLTKSIKKDTSAVSSFLNVFGIPIIFDDTINEESIIDDLFEQVSNGVQQNRSNDFQITEQDFQAYLEYARALTVEFDSNADLMLRNYFIATKKIRPDTLTEKAYEMLRKFSESHAKLCLRKTVKCQDVLVAISISEKFIKLLFENDSYSSPNESKVKEIGHYDEYMNSLFQWYSCFTKDILEKL